MGKFGRNYILNIDLMGGGSITIKPPFTVEFDVQRDLNSSANSATLRIYNLSAKHRNEIRFNQNDQGLIRQVTFQAGYGDNLSLLHRGQIQEAHSYREGVNFISEITSVDLYPSYGTVDFTQTIPASDTNPVSKKQLLITLISA